ncbi:hypothetical protein GPLA_3646 [Paraglaciecola polaris LMG 21857]|uniref:Uncharacterized protein n=1 Tax=Paraglaciecola polaris LMG 21857 TaxID=1129793 RepID=K6ZEL6_9ALTE|nr:hypothetical protein GPLA_3646 [Paraglaciecola polaris LMG 21857]
MHQISALSKKNIRLRRIKMRNFSFDLIFNWPFMLNFQPDCLFFKRLNNYL